MEYDHKHVEGLSKRLLDGLKERIPYLVVNGDEEQRYPGNLNVSFAYVEGESLLMGLKIARFPLGRVYEREFGTELRVEKLGVEEDMAHTSIRYGIGRFTTDEEVDRAVELTAEVVEKLREMSPLYEMVQEGIDISKIQWSSH